MKTYILVAGNDLRVVKRVLGENPIRLLLDDGSSWTIDGNFGVYRTPDKAAEIYYPMSLSDCVPAAVRRAGIL